jgi:hypothetical protein
VANHEYLYFFDSCVTCDKEYVRKVVIRKKDRRYVYIPRDPDFSCGADGEVMTYWRYSVPEQPIVNLKNRRLDRSALEGKDRAVFDPSAGFKGRWYFADPPGPVEAEKHFKRECRPKPYDYMEAFRKANEAWAGLYETID